MKTKARRSFVRFISGDKIPGDNFKWRCDICGAEKQEVPPLSFYSKIASLKVDDGGEIKTCWLVACSTCGGRIGDFIKSMIDDWQSVGAKSKFADKSQQARSFQVEG